MFKNKNTYKILNRLSEKGYKENKTSILQLNDGLKIAIRHNIWDIKIFNEQFIENQYFKKNSPIELLKPKIVIDIGGYIGDFSLFCVKNFNSTVYSYEPMKENLDVFKHNLSLNENLSNNIHLYEMAVSDEDTYIDLYYCDNIGEIHSTILKKYKDKRNVKSITLSEIIKKINQDIDLIKIDAETSEYKILKSFIDTEEVKKVKYIVLENHFFSTPHIIKDLLKNSFDMICQENLIELYRNKIN